MAKGFALGSLAVLAVGWLLTGAAVFLTPTGWPSQRPPQSRTVVLEAPAVSPRPTLTPGQERLVEEKERARAQAARAPAPPRFSMEQAAVIGLGAVILLNGAAVGTWLLFRLARGAPLPAPDWTLLSSGLGLLGGLTILTMLEIVRQLVRPMSAAWALLTMMGLLLTLGTPAISAAAWLLVGAGLDPRQRARGLAAGGALYVLSGLTWMLATYTALGGRVAGPAAGLVIGPAPGPPFLWPALLWPLQVAFILRAFGVGPN